MFNQILIWTILHVMCYGGNESTRTQCCLKWGLYLHLSIIVFLSTYIQASENGEHLLFVWKCVNRLLMPWNVIQESKWDSLPKPKKPLKYLGFIQWKLSLIKVFTFWTSPVVLVVFTVTWSPTAICHSVQTDSLKRTPYNRDPKSLISGFYSTTWSSDNFSRNIPKELYPTMEIF